MKKTIFLALIGIIAIACNFVESESPAVLTQEKTPESLEKKSYLRRYDKNIIDGLFEEALEKDQALQELNDRIQKTEELNNDSLGSYEQYMRNNKKYWNAVKMQLYEISDSTLRNEMQGFFTDAENNFNQRIARQRQLAAQIEKQKRRIADQQLMMKLLVTERMMKSYQKNEEPDTRTLEAVIKNNESLLKDMNASAKKYKHSKDTGKEQADAGY